ncbi:MAG: hypothetical protein JRE20_00635, partial [Deltaproteobacteria bacterium]|nr:hypothetical protein [Deltaproteobacteria bacterium]
MQRKILFLLPIFILAAGFLTMQFLSSFKTTPAKEKPKQSIKIVETRAVAQQDVPAEI